MKNVAKLAKLWAAKTKGDIYSSAAVPWGIAYGAIVALCHKNEVIASPTLVNGAIHLGSNDGHLYAFGLKKK